MNVEILNWPGPPQDMDLGGEKRTGRCESIRAIIIYAWKQDKKLPM
jgi:hypothetical protein